MRSANTIYVKFSRGHRSHRPPGVVAAEWLKFAAEWWKFSVGVALTLALPQYLLTVSYTEILPFYLLPLTDALGIALGIAIFRTREEGVLSCLPAGNTPRVRPYANAYKLRKAA